MDFTVRRTSRLHVFLFAAGIAGATACGSGSSSSASTSTSQSIGSTGGSVTLAGGPSLQIPAGALAATTTITVQESGQSGSGGGKIYDFGPTGTTFSQPVTVQMPVPAGVTVPTIYWTQAGSTTQFDPLPTTVSGSTASAQVNHFSLGYVGSAPAAATPTFSPAAGTFTTAQSVTLSSTTPSASIYYTTDGTTPTTSSTLYSAPVSVAVTTTLKAIAIAAGLSPSAVGSATYTINLPQAATPTFSPAAGTFTTALSVTL